MTKLPELSLFFPFWNEEQNIESVVKKAIPVIEKMADKWEIIMVDDGSSDKTLEIARNLASENYKLVVASYGTNRGYGAALKTGFVSAKYEYVVFTDGDGQFDFSEISKFIEKIDHCDAVIGFRKKRLDYPFRHLLMNLLKVWDWFFFRFSFKDIDCGFKLFRKSALDKIMP